MPLKPEIIDKIKQHRRLKNALIDYYNISWQTLDRYLRNNDRSLTEWGALQLIGMYLEAEEVTELVDSSIDLQVQP